MEKMRPDRGSEHALIYTRRGELQQPTGYHLRRGPLPLVLARRTPYYRKMGKLTLEPDWMTTTNYHGRYSAPPPTESSSPWEEPRPHSESHRRRDEAVKNVGAEEGSKERRNWCIQCSEVKDKPAKSSTACTPTSMCS